MIQRTKVSMTSAQIKTMHSSPFLVLPAPGANLFIDPISIIIRYTFGTVAYTGSSNVMFFFGTTQGVFSNMYSVTASAILTFASSRTIKVGNPTLNPVVDQIPNNQQFTIYSDVGDPVNGDGTFDIYITYRIVSV